MDNANKPKQINVRVPADAFQQLRQRAEMEGRSIGNLLQNIVRRSMEQWKAEDERKGK